LQKEKHDLTLESVDGNLKRNYVQNAKYGFAGKKSVTILNGKCSMADAGHIVNYTKIMCSKYGKSILNAKLNMQVNNEI